MNSDSYEKQFSRRVIRQLKEARMKRGVSQEDVALRMGTTKSSISRLEKGDQNISLEMAARYSLALGLQPQFLFEEEKAPQREASASAGGFTYEPFSEVMAYQVARRMELDAVPCELAVFDGVIEARYSPGADSDLAFVPAGSIAPSGGIDACLAAYEALGQPFYGALCSMLAFDALIYQESRSFGGFGLLKNRGTEEWVAAAPLRANGKCLFYRASKEAIGDIQTYAETIRSPYGMPYEQLCARVLGPQQKDRLRAMIHFSFREHDSVEMPRRRIRAIEEQLQRRVYQLLHL